MLPTFLSSNMNWSVAPFSKSFLRVRVHTQGGRAGRGRWAALRAALEGAHVRSRRLRQAAVRAGPPQPSNKRYLPGLSRLMRPVSPSSP